MITFRYPEVALYESSRGHPDKEVFAQAFKEHYVWLEENSIEYQVNIFYWPLMLSRFHTSAYRHIGLTMAEVDVLIEDVPHAIMFRLYSGMTPKETDFDT